MNNAWVNTQHTFYATGLAEIVAKQIPIAKVDDNDYIQVIHTR